MDEGVGIGANSAFGFHSRLLVISFARSVKISIMMYHSAGLKEPPNVRRRYINAQSVVVRMHFAADVSLKCMRVNAASRSIFVMRMDV